MWQGGGVAHTTQEYLMRVPSRRDSKGGNFVGGSLEMLDIPFLFTPVNTSSACDPPSQAEEAYNRAQILTRNTIERCFGVWKQRFRCLLTGFTVNLENAKLYTVALAVLHNISIDMGEELENLEPPASRQVHPVTTPQAGSSEHVRMSASCTSLAL
ncbi:putative nuclease HARBI1 [Ostrinia furnacalis]|uniref:putative nuclease HARBI1 n=1 Tax=Ostrinia furnacalis TaxID=93504 RepID=UPI00103DAEDF|nr:putative nuclease HARBI1 [Ostrinia furnacalis]